ncbi:MAG: short-chain dehydrogenase [Burkholderiales bacterium RIFCSPHIGHO2_12_FULL_61_11]|nr:MAG: short-chain dehydrogenase [Burkholderiales bacterium RIFCSPHIGHO2_12_FULL_61_11]
MSNQESIIIVGGTSGIGRQLAQTLADHGESVVITGRDRDRAQLIAAEIGGKTTGIAVDLAQPKTIAQCFADVGKVKHVVLAAIERDENSAKEYDIDRAIRLVTLKLVGYTEVVHQLVPRFVPDASVVLFGGLAKERPYPGSTTVTTVNGGVTSMIRTLAVELAPIRVNAVHPGIVGDTPAWSEKSNEVLDAIKARTPTGRLVETQDVVDAVIFLLQNRSINGVNLIIDGGWLLR